MPSAEKSIAHKAIDRSQRWVILVAMCAGYFLVLLDVTIVNVALPTIGSGLHTSTAGLQWVVDGYALALAALLLTAGTTGDLRGHKRVVLSGFAVFGAGSLACGLAPNVGVLIGARVAQGVGAALALPGTLAIISQVFPTKAEQARAIGIWAAVGSVALPAGPLLGGMLVDGIGWRAVFFLNVPLVLVAGLVAARMVPESRGSHDQRQDWVGAALGAALLATLTFAVIQLGHGGISAVTTAAFVLAAMLLTALLAAEHSRTDPMLPLALFRRPSFAVANAVAGVMNLGTLGLLFLLTMYLQTVQHRSAFGAGVALLPLFLPLSLLAPATGRLTARLGAKLPMAVGLVTAAVGVALLARLHANSGYTSLLPAMLLWGVGLGLLTPAVVAAALGSVPAEHSGLASGVNNTARQAGGACGIAVFGALAGSAALSDHFMAGFRLAGIATALCFLAAATATVVFIR